MADLLPRHPLAFGHWLGVLDFRLSAPQEIAIVGHWEAEDTRAMIEIINGTYSPNKVIAVGAPGSLAAEIVPLLQGRPQVAGKATAYICRHMTCEEPITDLQALKERMERS